MNIIDLIKEYGLEPFKKLDVKHKKATHISVSEIKLDISRPVITAFIKIDNEYFEQHPNGRFRYPSNVTNIIDINEINELVNALAFLKKFDGVTEFDIDFARDIVSVKRFKILDSISAQVNCRTPGEIYDVVYDKYGLEYMMCPKYHLYLNSKDTELYEYVEDNDEMLNKIKSSINIVDKYL